MGGSRNKHRRGRSGGGGGGGGGGPRHHQHHGFGTGEPNGLQPGDDLGNRKSFKAVQLPPDDLGNRKDPEEAEWVPLDDVGNRIDAAPTHEVSGVLLDMGGKNRRGRRPKGVSAPERVGRYVVGGVNPLIATTTPRPFPGKSLEESYGTPAYASAPIPSNDDGDSRPAEPRYEGGRGEGSRGEGPPVSFPDSDFEDDGQGGRRRRRRGRGREDSLAGPPDGGQAQQVSQRRAQRFFDFEEDDRFDYTLKTTAEQKRKDSEDAVRSVVSESGRDATVLARLIEDGNRPKVLVTIEERGAAASLPPERRTPTSGEPLFVIGNAALMSLNYLVNKVVNRYPDDRIRLAILPAADERLYLDALTEHQALRRAPTHVRAPSADQAPSSTQAPSSPRVPSSPHAPSSAHEHAPRSKGALSDAHEPPAARAHAPAPAHAPAGPRSGSNGAALAHVVEAVILVPRPSLRRTVVVATPVPAKPAAPPEAFEPPLASARPDETSAKATALRDAEMHSTKKVKRLAGKPLPIDDDNQATQAKSATRDNESAPSKKKAKAAPKAKAPAKKAPAKKTPAKKAPAKKTR